MPFLLKRNVIKNENDVLKTTYLVSLKGHILKTKRP